MFDRESIYYGCLTLYCLDAWTPDHDALSFIRVEVLWKLDEARRATKRCGYKAVIPYNVNETDIVIQSSSRHLTFGRIQLTPSKANDLSNIVEELDA